MNWYHRIFRIVPEQERGGIHLNTEDGCWSLAGTDNFSSLFGSLDGWLKKGDMLYFEDCSSPAIARELEAMAVVPNVRVRLGTVWPRPLCFHIPAMASTLNRLATLMGKHAEPELAIHFHVYRDECVIVEWHDAFTQPMLISAAIPEADIRSLAQALGTSYRAIPADASL